MTQSGLAGCHILLVEDEYMLADEMNGELVDQGAVVVGPVGTLDQALALVRNAPRVDGAVLDLNLGGEPAFPVADLLIERRIPMIFTTGYDASTIPARFSDVPRCEKPVSMDRIRRALAGVLT